MRAVVAETFGDADVLEIKQVDVPRPQSGEVLIKIAAAGINRPDVLQRFGRYAPPEGVTNIFGLECSGEIVALGEGIHRYSIGDKVCALVSGGGYAEYVAAPEGQCLPIPAGLDMVQAAALPESIFTVWANLFELGQLKENEIALVHGGSSGIGIYAIQMAVAAGAHIIVTVGNDQKAEACIKLGATMVWM
ncbi:MAG: alcohol dehydrogenase catalytic domain-containing protein, partial [Alphaproteobacteria bacterium]|nr:alcohol dehydrogenase catalytic domain-containing protein [Alphaproteobacteria bacterium]